MLFTYTSGININNFISILKLVHKIFKIEQNQFLTLPFFEMCFGSFFPSPTIINLCFRISNYYTLQLHDECFNSLLIHYEQNKIKYNWNTFVKVTDSIGTSH